MTTPTIGLWVDDAPALTTTEKYWDDVAEHHVRTVGVMLEPRDGGFDPRLTTEDLRALGSAAAMRDIEVVLTIWPQPTTTYVEDMRRRLPALLGAAGARALELDAEPNWMPGEVQGYASLHEASDDMGQALDDLRSAQSVRVELTTHTYHPENGPKARLAPRADRLLPQAYSVAERNDKPVPWAGQLGPGAMQRLTLDRAKTVPNAPKLSCGLAAYQQKWPDRDPHDAMRIAWESALAYSPLEIRFWSSKWVLGARKNGYASRFLKGLRA